MPLLIAALLAVVQEPPPPPKPADRIVCRREARTGTRFKSSICHTQAQWDEIAAAAQRNAHEMADRPVIPLTGKSQ